MGRAFEERAIECSIDPRKPLPFCPMTEAEQRERIERLSKSPDSWDRFVARLEQDVLDARQNS